MMWITDFYTGDGSRFVERIARASEGGHATNIIAGLAVGMQATVIPVVRDRARDPDLPRPRGPVRRRDRRDGDALARRASWSRSTPTARSPTTPAASPRWPSSATQVRSVTDPLDAFGNTTKAVTKGYAIASAGLAAVVLFATYIEDLRARGHRRRPSTCRRPLVLAGLFIGAMIPFVFASFAMNAVGQAGSERGRGGAPPVPRDPGHHGGHRQARLPHLRRHRDARRAAPDDRARADPGRDPDRGRASCSARGRSAAC